MPIYLLLKVHQEVLIVHVQMLKYGLVNYSKPQSINFLISICMSGMIDLKCQLAPGLLF